MLLTNETNCPTSHPYEVFYEYFPGANDVCDCMNSKNPSYKNIKFNIRCGSFFDNEKDEIRSEGCHSFDAIQPIVMA